MSMNDADAKSNTTKNYAIRYSELALKARSVIRDINPLDDLTFFRVKGHVEEIMVAPGK